MGRLAVSIERDFQAGCRLAAELRASGLVTLDEPQDRYTSDATGRAMFMEERGRLLAALRGAGVLVRTERTRRSGAAMLAVDWVPVWAAAFWCAGGLGLDPPGRDRVLQFLEADHEASAALEAVARLDEHGAFELLLQYLVRTTPPGDLMSFRAPDGSGGAGEGGVGFTSADGFAGSTASRALGLRPR